MLSFAQRRARPSFGREKNWKVADHGLYVVLRRPSYYDSQAIQNVNK